MTVETLQDVLAGMNPRALVVLNATHTGFDEANYVSYRRITRDPRTDETPSFYGEYQPSSPAGGTLAVHISVNGYPEEQDAEIPITDFLALLQEGVGKSVADSVDRTFLGIPPRGSVPVVKPSFFLREFSEAGLEDLEDQIALHYAEQFHAVVGGGRAAE